jgi:hypothetical protein
MRDGQAPGKPAAVLSAARSSAEAQEQSLPQQRAEQAVPVAPEWFPQRQESLRRLVQALVRPAGPVLHELSARRAPEG